MKTKLISLAALAMADFVFLAADVAAGTEFEVDADHAEGLLTAGKAKLAEPAPAGTTATTATPAAKTKTVKARVLTACACGQPNDLADIPADQAKAAEKDGLIDTDKAAVAYAAGLEQNSKQG